MTPHRGDELNARQIKVLNKLLDIGNENFKGDLTKKKGVQFGRKAILDTKRKLLYTSSMKKESLLNGYLSFFM